MSVCVCGGGTELRAATGSLVSPAQGALTGQCKGPWGRKVPAAESVMWEGEAWAQKPSESPPQWMTLYGLKIRPQAGQRQAARSSAPFSSSSHGNAFKLAVTGFQSALQV